MPNHVPSFASILSSMPGSQSGGGETCCSFGIAAPSLSSLGTLPSGISCGVRNDTPSARLYWMHHTSTRLGALLLQMWTGWYQRRPSCRESWPSIATGDQPRRKHARHPWVLAREVEFRNRETQSTTLENTLYDKKQSLNLVHLRLRFRLAAVSPPDSPRSSAPAIPGKASTWFVTSSTCPD